MFMLAPCIKPTDVLAALPLVVAQYWLVINLPQV